MQLRCQGLVAAAAGPAPAVDENVHGTWFELSPVSGKRILAGVGRSVPDATTASALGTREALWANAMAGLAPPELAETSVGSADSVYAVVDPTNGRVELGRAGPGTSVLIIDGTETRLVQPATSEAGVGHAISFELSAGSTLILLTHDPVEREVLTSVIQRALAARWCGVTRWNAVRERRLVLRNGPLSRVLVLILALHFGRLNGSSLMRSPSDPPPIAGEVVHEDALVADGRSKVGFHQSEHHAKLCRRSGRLRGVYRPVCRISAIMSLKDGFPSVSHQSRTDGDM